MKRSAPLLVGVFLPWLASRLLVAIVFAAVTYGELPAPRSSMPVYARWDGGWYLEIARRGYDFSNAKGQTPYPFFPLFPAVLRLADDCGFSPRAAGAVLDHGVFLVGLWGVYEAVRQRFSPRVASAACWSLALFPGSATYSMVYPSAMLLAFAAWAFVADQRGRPWCAGALAALATLVRPNGIALALALAAGALVERRALRDAARLLLPSMLALLGWMAILWWSTGDPLVFVHAKAGWEEYRIFDLLAGTGSIPPPRIDLAAAVFAGCVLLATVRRIPAGWLVFSVLWLVPSLFLGILGMPRYVSTCFPVFAGTGTLLCRMPWLAQAVVLLGFAVGLGLLANRIAMLRLTP